MSDRLEQNKQNVMAFYDMAFNQGKPQQAVDLYVGEEYIQHNPGVPTGKQGFIDYFKQMAKEYPGRRVEFRRAIAEGDLVVVHTFQDFPGHSQWASMDIFRVDADGKIVEHWDVLQQIPDETVHDNTMF